jgi:NAD(P)-dependent dehydrogenase (short-subunit alcohol dehydrogenase family)
MLAKTLSVELGPHKIRVNSVSLGCVWTPAFEKFVKLFGGTGNLDAILANVKARTPLGDPMIPIEDVVNTILFVLSNMSSMMTGENVVLDGGFCAT